MFQLLEMLNELKIVISHIIMVMRLKSKPSYIYVLVLHEQKPELLSQQISQEVMI